MGKRIKNWFIFWLVRALFGTIRLMGLERSRRFGRWLGRVAYKRGHTERRRSLANLCWAFEPLPDAEIQALSVRAFEHLGAGVAEVVNAHKLKPITDCVLVEPDSRKALDDLLARGRGVVFVTGHLGNWELMARGLATYGYPINTIGQKSYDPRFTKLLARFRDEGRVNTLWRGEADLIPRMVEVLKRGHIMGLLIDQDTDVPGCFVDFFGRKAWTPTAAAVLARKTGSPIIMGANHRTPEGRFSIVMEEFDKSESDDFEAAVAEDTAGMTAWLEQRIRAHPEQWVWMHRRWKTRPEGESQRC